MKIFIAKLNFSTNSEDLEQLFEKYGKVKSAKVIVDKESGKSKGYGFVEMDNYNDGAKAIEELDGTSVGGREIVVKQAEPKGVPQNPRYSSYMR